MVPKGVDAMWFLPSALNVNVKKLKQTQVHGGSNYDSRGFYSSGLANPLLLGENANSPLQVAVFRKLSI